MSATPENQRRAEATRERYLALDHVERALSLAFTLPRLPTPPAVRTGEFRELDKTYQQELAAAQAAFRGPLEELHELVGRGHRISSLCSEYLPNRNQAERFQDGIHLAVLNWAGTDMHRDRRMALIVLLIDLREAILDRMWTFPDASSEPLPGAPAGSDNSPTSAQSKRPHWHDLTDRQQQILECISGGRKSAKEIGAKLGIGEAAAKAAIRPLRAAGILGNTRRGGYFVSMIPEGLPELIKRPRN